MGIYPYIDSAGNPFPDDPQIVTRQIDTDLEVDLGILFRVGELEEPVRKFIDFFGSQAVQ